MTSLTVWADDDPDTVLERWTDLDDIARALAPHGVRLQRWPLVDLARDATAEQVLAAYRGPVDEVSAREGYGHVDVAIMTRADDPQWREKAQVARGKFLAEHRHADDEDRFFARGSGVFYLHLDGRVHAVLCTAGDLISVPGKIPHWFDMGERPDFVAVRFFHDEQGWVGDFTGSPIAGCFPTHDQLSAEA